MWSCSPLGPSLMQVGALTCSFVGDWGSEGSASSLGIGIVATPLASTVRQRGAEGGKPNRCRSGGGSNRVGGPERRLARPWSPPDGRRLPPSLSTTDDLRSTNLVRLFSATPRSLRR